MALKQGKIKVKGNRGSAAKTAGGEWKGDVKEFDIRQISGLTLDQWGRMDKRVLDAKQRTFYDSAVIVDGVDLVGGHEKALFVKGYSQDDKVWNDNSNIAEKGELMTNMEHDGQFSSGTLTVLKRIEVDIDLNSSKATAYTRGAFPTNCTAVAVGAYDPSLVFNALASQIKLQLQRGANKQIICEGLLEEFPVSCAASGAGSNSFFIQNGPGIVHDEKLMFPEVFEGTEDFKIILTPLNDTLRVPVPVVIQVKLKTTQVYTVYR